MFLAVFGNIFYTITLTSLFTTFSISPPETVRDLAEPPAFPPVILTQPQSLTVDYGQPSHLDCSARGENITYDWYIVPLSLWLVSLLICVC